MLKSLLLLLVFSFFFILLDTPYAVESKNVWWKIQSIDVMKYSRDIAREKLKDKRFDRTIEEQVKNIADTGATHIAIGTPYDEEFIPFLKRWVDAARKHELKVWFRGNFSGWEKWFGYPSITRDEHTQKVKEFIKNNPDLFEDGDLFTSCTECENGGPGDPRKTGDTEGHRIFLIKEYQTAKSAFSEIGKDVMANTYSMNGDVARLIMDRETTDALDGVVVIDHYVKSPDKLSQDIQNYARDSGGKVILGEFGAPIPDIHGGMNDQQQDEYLNSVFQKIAISDDLIGVNYWVNVGGSTQIWNENGTPRKAVNTLTKYYTPTIIKGTVYNEINQPIKYAKITSDLKTTKTGNDGKFSLAFIGDTNNLTIESPGYKNSNLAMTGNKQNIFILEKENPNIFYKALKAIYNLFGGPKLGQN